MRCELLGLLSRDSLAAQILLWGTGKSMKAGGLPSQKNGCRKNPDDTHNQAKGA